MELQNCVLLCFCSNRNKLTKVKFSEVLAELTRSLSERTAFERELLERGIFRYRRRTRVPSGKAFLTFGIYVLPPVAQIKSAIADLRKASPAIFRKNAEQLKPVKHFAVENHSFSLSMRIVPADEKSFGLADFSQTPIFVNKALSLIKKVKPRKLRVQECVAFKFDKTKTKLAGGLVLPMELPLGKELVERTGEASIRGFELDFKKSPLGLKQVAFSLRQKNLIVRVIALPFFSISTETLKSVYDHSFRMARVFLEMNRK